MDKKKILVIEDEKAIADILVFNLQREGYDTLVAYDGTEGLRCALEELAVQLACDRIDPERMQQLLDAAAHFRDILGTADITELGEADEAFHDVIFQATDNRRLIQLLNNLREQMYRYRIEYPKKKECYPQLLEEHAAIIQAIREHDKVKATEITVQHINNQVDTVVDTLRHR